MKQNPMNPSPSTNIDWYDKYLPMEHKYIRAQARLRVALRDKTKLQRMLDEILAKPGRLHEKTGSPDRPQSMF